MCLKIEYFPFLCFFSPEPSFPLITESNSDDTSGTSCRVSWSRPKFSTGLTIEYSVTVKYVKSFHYIPEECQSYHQKSFKVHVLDTTYTYDNAYPDSLYTFQVQAINGDYISDSSSIIQCRTSSTAPGKIRNLNVDYENVNNASMPLITWGYPCEPNGDLSKFTIFVNNLEINSPEYFDIDAENRSNFAYRMSPLRNDINDFVVKIRTENSQHQKGAEDSLILCSTKGCAFPDLSNQNFNLTTYAYTTTVKLTIPKAIFLSTNSEDIVEISVLIAQIDCRHDIEPKRGLKRNADKLATWSEAQKFDCIPQYRTALIPRNVTLESGNSENFFDIMIGDESACVYFFINCNGPLKPSTWYGIVLRLETNRGFADLDFIAVRTRDDVSIFDSFIGDFIIAFALLGTLFVLVVFIIMWRRESDTYK